MAVKEALVFRLNERLYGMGIQNVIGIEPYSEFHSETVKGTNYVGSVTLRGEEVAVYDIRAKFHLEPITALTEDARFLLIRHEEKTVAFVLDEVKGMRRFPEDIQQEVPKILQAEETRYLDYVVKYEEQLVLILRPEFIVD